MSSNDKEPKVLDLRVPFTKQEYFSRSTEERRKMVLDIFRQRRDTLPKFDVDNIRSRLEDDSTNTLITCDHEACCIDLVFQLEDKEKELELLRQRIEDLCIEMDRTKNTESRTFLLGPGASS